MLGSWIGSSAARVRGLVEFATGGVVGRTESLAKSAARAVGREVAEGFLEYRRELQSGVREIASEVGDSLTAAALERASSEAGSPPPPSESRADRAETPRERPLHKVAREVGKATASGAVDGVQSRVRPWQLLAPFVAGVAASVAIAKALGAREPGVGRA